MFELNNFDSIQISIASPEKIREWSYGEVTKPETINYRTQKPEKDGLFCERIFGPTKDWECSCGKYKRIRYKGVVCDKCGVEVTRAKVRRERMGHIELAAPVSHIWYFKGVPSRIGLLLDMSPKALEQVIYFAAWVVLDPGVAKDDLQEKQIINDRVYRELLEKYSDKEKYGATPFKCGMGAEAIKELLMAIDLDKDAEETKKISEKATGQKRAKAIKRLEILESFRRGGNRPEWMILDVVPVIPPELRPMVQLDGGRFAVSDLNDLYRRVINRNNRLRKLMELGAPDIIVRNEKRMLQEAVDALIDNGRRGKAVAGPGNRELKSLSGMLRGKQGRFRQNLLGKRVDYSGRSVIVVGPELKLQQCGLPKEMALELFKPFVMKELVEMGLSHNIRSAKRKVERMDPEVWDILERVIKDHPVLLNRAPTLHRLSIQAFQPVLIEGRAIKLHPLVCGAFNADFDGDQMAVHVPLSKEAQDEARYLMLASNNILKLADGQPVISLAQDMVLGAYYLTMERAGEIGEGRVFMDFDEAMMAYQNKEITLQSKVYIRVQKEIDGKVYSKRLHTTLGKMIFNQAVPQNLGFVPRNTPEQMLDLEIDFKVGKSQLKKIAERSYKVCTPEKNAEVLDALKSLGFRYSTVAAITTSVFDMHVPKTKYEYLAEAEKKIVNIEEEYDMGMLSEDERYNNIIATWQKTEKQVTDALKTALDEFNPIMMMADSGARGSMQQIRQLSGMRGLMTNPSGKTIEVPVKASFREGLNVLEYFISSHGGRKGLADTALKTADSGYLTRRLVDVAQEVIVKEDDCFESNGERVKGIVVSAIKKHQSSGLDEIIERLADRIAGRYTVEDIINPLNGEVMVKANEMISEEMSKEIEKVGIESVKVRSVLTCRSKNGVCAKCYGKNMANGKPVGIGEAVGIIAAQSIGEPGTQLTMRNFHSGGVAGGEDITQGLPRVEELFEARKPKGMAIVCEYSGKANVRNDNGIKTVVITLEDGSTKEYQIPYGVKLKVDEKGITEVEPGTVLTEGSVNPHDILKTRGVKGVQEYITMEVQSTYRSQGVEINDKHIEVIVRQMLKKVKVEDVGDTDILPGDLMDVIDYEAANEKALMQGGRPATAKRELLGITKASLATDSWLASASFQETARVLTESAIRNKVDPLIGLKENVIIGKLIPAGTGLAKHSATGNEFDYMGVNAKAEELAMDVEDYEEDEEDLSLEA
ncbi:MAG: DNA-directed RNA polymerase subunit beta' [Clostridia bacterium]|nr:DNA-directed RNA polymerase subunit beta' [Clostridia bacterium]